MYDNSSRVIEVDINEILPNRFQPRIQFDEEEILELSDSIKEHGIIQPLVVRAIGDKYEIIAGERRYKASVLAGKETVPVIVKNLNDKDSAEIALIENIQRKNLTPIEEALSYKKILDMGYITQENLASKLGKSQSAVANKIRLLNLSDEVQEALLENKISERHARSLLKLSTSKQQNEMLNKIINERLTVRRTDEEIEKMKNSISNTNSDETKIIGKGENNMNNNMFGIPNVPQNNESSVPSFDIFGTANSQSEMQNFNIFETNSINGENSENPSTNIQSINSIANTNNEAPTVPNIPVAPEIPAVQPVMPEMPVMGGIQFDENGTVIANTNNETPTVPQTPTVPNIPVAPEIPAVQPVMPEMPIMGGIQFDENGTVIANTNNETPTVPTPAIEPIVPQTSPIIETPIVDNTNQMRQQDENLFSFGENVTPTMSEQTNQESATLPEFKMPEPIIVTDYTKQYDPVMPAIQENIVPTVDFKEVINIIRDCSNKIEKYGFKIDVEEYDLANLYQVIFKIEK